MSKSIKTNALRLLNRDHIADKIIEYQYDEEHLSGSHIINQVNMKAEDIYKTLVLVSDKKEYLVCCIPVLKIIDLKKLALLSHHKKVEMIPMKDLLKITGYIRGGCSPIGMKKKFPIYFDSSILKDRPIALSAGKRGYQMVVSALEILDYVEGICGEVTRNEEY